MGLAILHDATHTLQLMARGYQMFMVDWSRIARQELEAVFGQPLPTTLR